MMKPKKEGIVIGGYYGFGSIGDEAILDLILESVRETSFFETVYVISKRGGNGENAVEISRFSLLRIVYTFIKCRVFIFGGGSLLQDSTSKRSLWYYEALLLLAKVCGCKIYIFANGIGPVSQRRALKKLLSFADRVSVRDPESYEILKSLEMDVEVDLRADPVFKRAKGDYKKRPLACLCALSGKRYFAVSLRSCKRKGDIDLIALCTVISRIREEGLVPLYVPMQREYDLDICRRARLMTGGVIADARDIDDVMQVLSGAEFSIGMRLHFLIASAIVKTPLLALSYDRKVKSAALYLGLDFVADAFDFSAEELYSLLSKARAKADMNELFEKVAELCALGEEDLRSLSSFVRAEAGEAEKKQERAEQVSG
ncbi:MAG: polysaccharide pyruvyl transferase family protein [Clostridia bacterium]|nr:polysaccharide pyruvyl transferase family protein [Clostridia bacterium]